MSNSTDQLHPSVKRVLVGRCKGCNAVQAFRVEPDDEAVPPETLEPHWMRLALSIESTATTEACRCQEFSAVALRHGITDPARLERLLADGLAVERLANRFSTCEIWHWEGAWVVRAYPGNCADIGEHSIRADAPTLPEAVNAALGEETSNE